MEEVARKRVNENMGQIFSEYLLKRRLTVVRPKNSTKKRILSSCLGRNLNDEAAVPEAKPAHTKEPKRVGVMGWGGIWW